MEFRRRNKALAAATATMFAVTLVVTAAPAEAAAPPTVRVRISDNAILMVGGGATTANGVTTLRPGKYHFHVRAIGGGHDLQLMRFRGGYTPQQAQQDFPKLDQGDVSAVQRIDDGIDFLGGISATKKDAGDMVVKLKAGQYYAVDLASDAVAQLNVTGNKRNKSSAPSGGTFTAFTYGWGVSQGLPASGMVKFANQSDQPHFLVVQRVKDSTTNKQVRKFINSGGQGNPPWVLRGNAESGVVSPGHSQLFSYDLPPGKYVLACFWPDYFTGTPHVLHGMWKLVHLS